MRYITLSARTMHSAFGRIVSATLLSIAIYPLLSAHGLALLDSIPAIIALLFPKIGVPAALITTILTTIQGSFPWSPLLIILFIVVGVFYIPSALLYSVMSLVYFAMDLRTWIRPLFFVGYKRQYWVESQKLLRQCKSEFPNVIKSLRWTCLSHIIQNKRLRYFEPKAGAYNLLQEVTLDLKKDSHDDDVYEELSSFFDHISQLGHDYFATTQAKQKQIDFLKAELFRKK